MLAPDGNADATESAPAGSTTLSETLAAMWGAPLTGASATGAVTVLVAHLFFAADPDNPPEEPDEERPIAFVGGAPALSPAVVPAAVQYAACGHLHRAHSVGSGRPVRYSGSPLAYSFAESGQCKSVTIVEVEPRGSLGDEPTVYERPLSAGRPLVRCTADSVETALADLSANQGALVELQLRLPEYLAAADRRRLHDAHDGLISIVPIITGVDDSAGADRVSVDPRGDMRELFSQYFGFKHGVPPDAAILDAFDEVVSAVSATDRDQGETP
jgi:exonuclease SbcD